MPTLSTAESASAQSAMTTNDLHARSLGARRLDSRRTIDAFGTTGDDRVRARMSHPPNGMNRSEGRGAAAGAARAYAPRAFALSALNSVWVIAPESRSFLPR